MSRLYIVPTPIGNLEDLTFRAKRVLGEVDVILAEDTRKTGILLKHYSIDTPMQSYHQYNEHRTAERVISRLAGGGVMALVTDAGTPAISDPGFLLVRSCISNNIAVETLPGPTAFVPALVNSGLKNDRFCFEGFLPHKKGRKKRLEKLVGEERTVILYESPHRLVKTLQQLSGYFGGESRVAVSRELTKIHEENFRGSFVEAIEHFQGKPVKGEIVIVLEPSA